MRYSVNKRKSARSFGRGIQRTKKINIAPPAQRGGYRL